MYVTGPFLMTNLLCCNSGAVKFTTTIPKQMVETANYTPGMWTLFTLFFLFINMYIVKHFFFQPLNKNLKDQA